jgi:hypothetical protein
LKKRSARGNSFANRIKAAEPHILNPVRVGVGGACADAGLLADATAGSSIFMAFEDDNRLFDLDLSAKFRRIAVNLRPPGRRSGEHRYCPLQPVTN